MWPEVESARKEKKRELNLVGTEISGRIQKDGLDKTVFLIESLNLLNISETELSDIPEDIAKLKNLQNLLLYRNKITSFPSICEIDKLKVLDLSFNQIKQIPDEINALNLTTINLSNNELESFPALKNTKVIVLNISGNKLSQFPELEGNEQLSELHLNGNSIEQIPDSVENLSTLKLLNLEDNQIKTIPKALSNTPKLKDLFLKKNPVSDKRLLKLINQCGTKQVLDYVKQHGTQKVETESSNPGKGDQSKKRTKGKGKQTDSESESKPIIFVQKFNDSSSLRIVCSESVMDVRPHIICCIWRDISFDKDSFKQFIQLQTKLHETVCEKRELCTIATHDLAKIGKENCSISYSGEPSSTMEIIPLGRGSKITGIKLFEELSAEAEALRKEKKRNTYSGIHKYLHLLGRREAYACLKDSNGVIISFPPLTNSENSRISVETKDILVEITSHRSLPGCKRAFEMFWREVVNKRIGVAKTERQEEDFKLTVEQVKVVDFEGNLRNIYPSSVDLTSDNYQVKRQD